MMHLTPKERAILNYLKAHPNQPIEPEVLYQSIWQQEPYACRPILSVHICHLRQKIEDDPSNPSIIRSIFNQGYLYYE